MKIKQSVKLSKKDLRVITNSLDFRNQLVSPNDNTYQDIHNPEVIKYNLLDTCADAYFIVSFEWDSATEIAVRCLAVEIIPTVFIQASEVKAKYNKEYLDQLAEELRLEIDRYYFDER